MRQKLLPLICLFVLPLLIASATVVVNNGKNFTSAEPTWVNSPFFRAGSEQVISSFTGSGQYPFASYSFTFSSPVANIPNLAYGIQRYKRTDENNTANDYMGSQFFQIRKTGLTSTTFSVQIQIYGVTNIWILAVAYLAVDPTFPHHLNSFDNVPVNKSAGNLVFIFRTQVNITKKSNDLKYYSNYINYTDQASGRQFRYFTAPYSGNHIVIFMTSFWLGGSFGNPLEFHIYPQIVNQSFYMWNVTVWKQASLTNVHFSQLIFNSDDVYLNSQTYFIMFQKWYNNASGGFLEIPIQFADNFIVGLVAFQMTETKCGFSYNWEIVNSTANGTSLFGVEMQQSIMFNGACGFSWTQSYVLYMMTWICDPSNVYFNITTMECQTLCGGFSFENTTDNSCDPCQNSLCYQCDGSNTSLCTDCASHLNFELVDGECVCMDGFMFLNDSCVPCYFGNTGCLNCSYSGDDASPFNSSLFECLQCNSTQDYFLNGTECWPCSLSNCLDCDSFFTCLVCDTGYNYSDAQTCIQCQVVGCLNCSASDQNNCTTCDSTLGYYNSQSNWNCSSLCGDGIYVSAQEGCDDNNTDDFDGCASNCSIEVFFSCSGSPSQCFFTSSASVSLLRQNLTNQSIACNHITFEFAVSPASDIFLQSFFNWENFITTMNSSLLWLNSSLSSFSHSNISLSYFMLGDLQNQTLVFEANFSSLLPNSSIFSNISVLTVDFTADTSPQALMGCCFGFFPNTTSISCEQICGDGILFDIQCDDNNTLDGDGCSSKCTIQYGYTCVNGSENSSSVCTYSGGQTFQIISGNKDPDKNALVLTYYFEPSAEYQTLNNGSTNFLSLVSFPENPGVTVQYAYINPATNELVIKIEFSEDLQGEELTLELTPPNVPQAFGTPNYTKTWVVQPTNQLTAVVYSQKNFSAGRNVRILVKVLSVAFLSVIFLTLVYRKFIGLELASLIQFGYLSLLHNKEITVFAEPITTWTFIFGFNGHHFSSQPSEALDLSYHIYNYQTQFGFSNNVMVLAALGLYLIGTLFFAISKFTEKGTAQRLREASFLIVSDLCYALVVFLSPNMLTAFFIQAKEGALTDWNLPWSKVFMLLAFAMLLFAHIFSLYTAEDSSDVNNFVRGNSKAGVYLPIIFNIRLFALTFAIFLFYISEHISSILLFLFQITYILFVMTGRPHLRKLDFLRSICVQIGMLIIFILRVLEIRLLSDLADPRSAWFPLIAYLQYAVYIVAVLLSFISFIYHVIKSVRDQKIKNLFEGDRIINESTLGDMADIDEVHRRSQKKQKQIHSKSSNSRSHMDSSEANIVFMHLEEQNNQFQKKIPLEHIQDNQSWQIKIKRAKY